jgi:hypothetical protein
MTTVYDLRISSFNTVNDRLRARVFDLGILKTEIIIIIKSGIIEKIYINKLEMNLITCVCFIENLSDHPLVLES